MAQEEASQAVSPLSPLTGFPSPTRAPWFPGARCSPQLILEELTYGLSPCTYPPAAKWRRCVPSRRRLRTGALPRFRGGRC
eukprot:2473475-Pyramimonas_sp.AAC.1